MQSFADELQDLGRNALRGPVRVDQYTPLLVLHGDGAKPRVEGLMIGEIFGLEPVRNGIAAPRMRAGKADLRRQVENEGQVGLGSPDSELLKTLDERQINLADDALIDPRGIKKAVADHPLLRPQGRFYERVEMVGARGRKQQGFRVGPSPPSNVMNFPAISSCFVVVALELETGWSHRVRPPAGPMINSA